MDDLERLRDEVDLLRMECLRMDQQLVRYGGEPSEPLCPIFKKEEEILFPLIILVVAYDTLAWPSRLYF